MKKAWLMVSPKSAGQRKNCTQVLINSEVLNKQMQRLSDCIHLLISIHCMLKLAIPNLLSMFHTVQAGKEFNGPHEFTVHFPCLTEVRESDTGML